MQPSWVPYSTLLPVAGWTQPAIPGPSSIPSLFGSATPTRSVYTSATPVQAHIQQCTTVVSGRERRGGYNRGTAPVAVEQTRKTGQPRESPRTDSCRQWIWRGEGRGSWGWSRSLGGGWSLLLRGPGCSGRWSGRWSPPRSTSSAAESEGISSYTIRVAGITSSYTVRVAGITHFIPKW